MPPAAKAAASQQKAVQVEACRQLKDFIEGTRCSASFACGGTISIGYFTQEDNPGPSRVSPPVTIGWSDEPTIAFSGKLMLPLNDTPVSNADALQQLVQACSPATFGRGGEDVLDTSYRKAGKLDEDKFLSSFHPADFGILNHVEQILLPSVSTDMENKLQFRRIAAELYKLNVYSGPSGLFRAHVDTPRSASQVGSLVVCLPSAFKGGNLMIRHHGREVDYDWSSESSSAIQWAAFYSDCEHEIKEPVKSIIVQDPIFKPDRLPVFEYIQGLIQSPEFMAKGGTLGLFCSHAYAHNSEITNMSFPKTLKGADMVLYSVFKALGIKVNIRPVLEYDGMYNSVNKDLDIKGKLAVRPHYYLSDYKDTHTSDVRVGRSLHEYSTTEGGGMDEDDNLDEIAKGVWPFDLKKGITWLTEPKHEEMAFTQLTYGNQAGIGTRYSCAAILATIPAYAKREQKGGSAD